MNIKASMNKTEYILRQLSKTNKKNYENYVITRIWFLLNDLNIKIVTQQHITRPSGRALTDLYFPQINLHVEINEGHHFIDGKKIDQDLVREADIISATGHIFREIKVCDVKYDINLSIIDKKIDDVVTEIKSIFEKNNPPIWDLESEYKPQTYIDRGFISVDENVAFRTIADACNCFGYNYKSCMRGFIKHAKEDKYLWFPKLYQNEDWDNCISSDEEIIKSEKIKNNDSWLLDNIEKPQDEKEKLVFARVRSSLGDVMYRFKGIYKTDKIESKRNGYMILRRTSRVAKTYKYEK